MKSIYQEYNHLVQIHYKTPADPKVRLCPDSYLTNIPIPMINGKFLYTSNTQPDISYVVGQICKFQTYPSKELENTICHLISYLNDCPNEEIKFVCPAGFNSKLMTVNLSVFCDAAFADQYDCCSTYGYLVFLCSNLIS